MTEERFAEISSLLTYSPLRREALETIADELLEYCRRLRSNLGKA